MSSKLVSTGIEFPDSSTQTTAATSGAADFSALTDATVSTTDPATDTNPSAVGHHWINKTSGEYFVCTDNTTDENVWVNIGEGEDGVVPIFDAVRGVFGGGTTSNIMDYITIATVGNALDFGDLVTARHVQEAACSSESRGVFAGGWIGSTEAAFNTIEYITFASTGNTTDFGNLTVDNFAISACASKTRGVFMGGFDNDWVNKNVIDYITIATAGNANSFGTLAVAKRSGAGCSDTIRGLHTGGYTSTRVNDIQYVTIATTGNAVDFGDLTTVASAPAATADATRGIIGGGSASGGPNTNIIGYVTIQTTGNATDFGDLASAINDVTACANATRGVFGGGTGPINVMQYVTIQTTGNTTDFGDLTASRKEMGACSGT